MTMTEYDTQKLLVKCPKCNSNKVLRDLYEDFPRVSVRLGDKEIKLGHLAQRNTDRISKDEKTYLNYEHNKYRYEEPTKELPRGMTRTKKRTEL